MQIQFEAVSELGNPGPKFQSLFNMYWPIYKVWIDSNKSIDQPDLVTSIAALEYHMPEMVPTYNRLCALVNADEKMAKFLTGFQPPTTIAGCSQAVLNESAIQLIRNYDYHPHLLEGTLLLSSWNGKKVIAKTDCLSGALDGMNENGLAVSLTFGGRKEVGIGFGISFIMRYVLEFCNTVDEAVAAFIRIPSHMSYNITVVDRTGSYKTILLSPDKPPVVTNAAFTTNHQGTVDWPENASFNNTIQRSQYLEGLLATLGWDPRAFSDAFLSTPLYSSNFKEGFGTLYTSIYQPAIGCMELRWPGASIHQTFSNFTEGATIINFEELKKKGISGIVG